jgi:hypothetical protein
MAVGEEMIYAYALGKPLPEILGAFDDAWHQVWENQPEEHRADPDSSEFGEVNCAAFCEIHRRLGIPNPLDLGTV